MLTIEPRMVSLFWALVHTVLNMSFSCLLFDPHLTTYHSNMGVQTSVVLDFDMSTSCLENIILFWHVKSVFATGVLLERTLPKLPRRRCWWVGQMKAGLDVQDAIKFHRQYDSELSLGINDCRHHTLGLIFYSSPLLLWSRLLLCGLRVDFVCKVIMRVIFAYFSSIRHLYLISVWVKWGSKDKHRLQIISNYNLSSEQNLEDL